MKRSLAKFLGITYLFAATHLMTISCASSDEGGDEEVAAEGDNNAADADGNNADGNNANNNGNNGDGNATAGNNEFGNQADGGNAAAMGAEGTAMNDAGAPAGGDEGTQQIIDEMNQAGGSGAAAADGAAPQQGFDNLAQNSAGKDGAAAAAPAAGQEGAQAAAPAAAPAAGAAVAPGLPELGSKMSYIVQKGDTLAKIAARIYGDVNKWTEIAEFTGLANPKLIYPGDVVYYQLTEKTQTFATAYEGIGRSEVQVGQGDTLATISSKVYGNSSLWKLIWRQNDKIDNPDKLVAGSKIFYVDQAKLAQLDKELSAKYAQDKVDGKAKIVKVEVSKTKKIVSKKVKTIEVANDQSVDFFGAAASQNLVNSLI